jgi:hypothetical protein
MERKEVDMVEFLIVVMAVLFGVMVYRRGG